MSLLRACIPKLVEINEWFGYREEKWEVVTGRGYGGGGRSGVGRCVPNCGYGYGEGTMVTMVGVGGCDGSVFVLEVCRGREA